MDFGILMKDSMMKMEQSNQKTKLQRLIQNFLQSETILMLYMEKEMLMER